MAGGSRNCELRSDVIEGGCEDGNGIRGDFREAKGIFQRERIHNCSEYMRVIILHINHGRHWGEVDI